MSHAYVCVLHKYQARNINTAHHIDTGFSIPNSSRLLFEFRTTVNCCAICLAFFFNTQLSDILTTVDVLGLVRYLLFRSECEVIEWLIIDFPLGSNLRTRKNPVMQV